VTTAPPEGFRQHRFEPPAGATTVILVRHGESAAARPDEPFPLVDGHGDPPLHENGLRQADLVGERLKTQRIDAIYVTTLQRTAQTAAPLAAALGLTPVVVADLREVHLGDWEGGLLRVKAAANDPVYERMHAEQRWDVIPNAEPLATFVERTQRGLRTIVDAHPGGRVVAVVHGGVIGCLLAHASGATSFAFNGSDNASISELVVDGDRQVVRRFNDSAHLYG
jgi:probable phosphoglycerate mutase